MTLYVRLNVEYADDDQFIEAGPLAELLYVRALCFCKKRMQDGDVSVQQVKRFGIGIGQPLRQARKLVEVGLWAETDDGFQIVDWLKWNKSAAEIEEERQVAKDAGERGNHERWHVGPDGKPSSKCRICREERRQASSGNPIGDPMGSTNRGRSPKEKPEPEPEPEPEPIPGTSSPSSNLSPTNRTTTTKDRRFETVIGLIADRQIAEHGPHRAVNADRYRSMVVNRIITGHRQAIATWLDNHPDAPAQLAADRLYLDVEGT